MQRQENYFLNSVNEDFRYFWVKDKDHEEFREIKEFIQKPFLNPFVREKWGVCLTSVLKRFTVCKMFNISKNAFLNIWLYVIDLPWIVTFQGLWQATQFYTSSLSCIIVSLWDSSHSNILLVWRIHLEDSKTDMGSLLRVSSCNPVNVIDI